MAAKNRNKPKPKKMNPSAVPAPFMEEKRGGDGSVNMEVDNGWKMADNELLSKRLRGARFGIKLLVKGEKCPAKDFLDLLAKGGNELGSLVAQVEALCRAARDDHHLYAKMGKGEGKGVFELKQPGKLFRLFYFYGEDHGLGAALVICTHGYSKGKPSRDEQNKEFRKAVRIMRDFLADRGYE